MSMDESEHATPQEESRLQFVYKRLCNFSVKYQLEREIEDIKDRLIEEDNRLKLLEKEWYERRVNRGKNIPFNRKEKEEKFNALSKSLEDVKRQHKHIEERSRSKGATISAKDIEKALEVLNVRFTKVQLEEMIWEIDEDADGKINWRDFKLMFNRNLSDKIGLEPARLFNLIQFMIYDVNENAHVSVDETMIMLYARYGRAKMEDKLKQLFGNNRKADLILTGKEGGEISFKQYLNAVNRLQKQKFWRSSIGELVMTSSSTPPSQKKMAREYIQAADGGN